MLFAQKTPLRFALLLSISVLAAIGRALPGYAPHSANPILPGYYADPSFVAYQNKYYIYATLDPWGGATLGCWESDDLKNWTYRELNWPTKQACTSPTSKGAMVWAPSVVRASNGAFYMYVSVGSEIWVGTAEHPLGPWRNALGQRPLVPENYKPGFHMIDAEGFIDEDGQAYLYWGSGWEWKNGRCWAVKLKADMVSFDGEPKDVTPANYFEGPFMVKRGTHYFLMYSHGKTTEDTYQVHYAVGESPLGPFTEGTNSPILTTDKTAQILSPGHHAVFEKDGRSYIFYHRHSIPFDAKLIGRQVCVDPLVFTPDGQIEKVIPSHEGATIVQGRSFGRTNLADGAKAKATASSEANSNTRAAFVLDDNYATRWAAAKDARGGWLQIDLGEVKAFHRQELRFEYAWKLYPFSMEQSVDGSVWSPLANRNDQPVSGSPVVIDRAGDARYLRLIFPETAKGSELSLFEWAVY